MWEKLQVRQNQEGIKIYTKIKCKNLDEEIEIRTRKVLTRISKYLIRRWDHNKQWNSKLIIRKKRKWSEICLLVSVCRRVWGVLSFRPANCFPWNWFCCNKCWILWEINNFIKLILSKMTHLTLFLIIEYKIWCTNVQDYDQIIINMNLNVIILCQFQK